MIAWRRYSLSVPSVVTPTQRPAAAMTASQSSMSWVSSTCGRLPGYERSKRVAVPVRGSTAMTRSARSARRTCRRRARVARSERAVARLQPDDSAVEPTPGPHVVGALGVRCGADDGDVACTFRQTPGRRVVTHQVQRRVWMLTRPSDAGTRASARPRPQRRARRAAGRHRYELPVRAVDLFEHPPARARTRSPAAVGRPRGWFGAATARRARPRAPRASATRSAVRGRARRQRR